MFISKVIIVNFKSYEGVCPFDFTNGVNILIGDNESGKSTILEAINLALTGTLSGRYVRNELSQHLFNKRVVDDYIEAANKGENPKNPHIYIEVHFEGEKLDDFQGNDNLEGLSDASGVYIKIDLNLDKYKEEYEELVRTGVKTVPVEFYDVTWSSFSRDDKMNTKKMPFKSAFIDSGTGKFSNGSDIYISRIVKDFLEVSDTVAVSQAHRAMLDVFSDDKSVESVNKKLEKAITISDKKVSLSIDLSPRNTWEGNLTTHLDGIPFHHVGRGEQSMVKTKLALSHKKAEQANILLIEEPENHLSHTNLNKLIKSISESSEDKQVIITTHSSFVANKLGIDKLILLSNKACVRLNELSDETSKFFLKLSGYDTLRLILCKRAILVEGPSDELVVQKAYMQLISPDGKGLPIDEGIDVISVGTSFKRFLEIADKLEHPTAVVTDTDFDLKKLEDKYQGYIGDNQKGWIIISYDKVVDSGSISGFNYNTLEPKLLKSNGIDKLNEVFGKSYSNDEDMLKYMQNNKTVCAMNIFETDTEIVFPEYIVDAIKHSAK